MLCQNTTPGWEFGECFGRVYNDIASKSHSKHFQLENYMFFLLIITVPKTINVDIYLRSRSRVNNDCCLRGRQQEPCTSDLLLIRGNRVNPTFSCPHSLILFSFKTETCCLEMPQRKHKYLTCSESWCSVRFL